MGNIVLNIRLTLNQEFFMKQLRIILVSFLFIVQPTYAQTEAEEEFAAVPLPPELPDPMESGRALEPEVTIIRSEKEMVEEYRVNGNLYMVKVTPTIGKPYYLIDNDGDGTLEQRDNDINKNPVVPQWTLFSW